MKINKAIIYILEKEDRERNTISWVNLSASLDKHMNYLHKANIANVLIVNDLAQWAYAGETQFDDMNIYHLKMDQPANLKQALAKCQGFIGEESFLLIKNDVKVDSLAPQVYNRLMNDYYVKRHSTLLYESAEDKEGCAAADILCEQGENVLIKRIGLEKSKETHVALVGIDILRPEIFDYLQDKNLQSEGFYGALNQMCQDQKVYGLELSVSREA